MKTIFFFLTLLQLSAAWSQSDYPEYFRYQILTTDKTTSTVTEQSFTTIPRIIYGLFATEFYERNFILTVNTDWQTPYFSAWAKQEGPLKYSISFWGGMARIPGMNDEAHALVACHEIGHILGGTPRLTIKDFIWSSSEGQSDYFATGICLKRYFKFLEIQKPSIEPQDIPETSYTLCRTQYESDLDFKVCLRSSKAIVGFGRLMMHLNKSIPQLGIDTPSQNTVSKTMLNSYPDEQCRIDTLFQGSLCPEGQFPCQGKDIGARPACWYRD